MKNLFIVLLVGLFFVSCEEDKTAYVDTTRLIQEYSEMKEVEAEFTERSEKIQKTLDSVAGIFQEEVKTFQAEAQGMSQAERQERQSQLMQKQQMLQQMQQIQANRLREESDAAVDSLVTQIKDFVEAYGEENGYTYIFGSNESANIMYAEEGLDITEEILAELNAEEIPAE